ncbi:MAG: amidase [Pseudonocardiales bacterium]|jgi:amidase|nr:amidase [Pseudonocardiales bacterium]
MLESGQATALEITRYYLQRIAALDPGINAVIATDPDRALAEAAASDARRLAAGVIGPLDGVPILIKDNIEAAGLPGTAGSRALLASPPSQDAPVVGRIRRAGMVLLGSTNLSEWANFRSTASTSGWSAVGGQTNNPYDPARNTSGSSSGSAAAVAAALAPLTVGTETDGSIVSPAGLCGVVGFKPTHGTVPGAGIVPISSRQDVAGPITRCVSDAARLYEVLAGVRLEIEPMPLNGLGISVWLPKDTEPETAAVLRKLADQLAAAGCVLASGDADPGGPFSDDEFTALLSEFAVELPAYLAQRPGQHPRSWAELLHFNRTDPVELSKFSDEIFALAQAAPSLESTDYLQARSRADIGAQAALKAVLAGHDYAITLTNRPAWLTSYSGSEDGHISTSTPAAVTGAPALTLQGGIVDGLPVGITVIGERGDDAGVLALGLAIEQLLPPRIDPPIAQRDTAQPISSA